MIRKGDKGEDVRRLQHLLGLAADGVFGQKTHDAVVAFQRAHGLTPDGIVGALTWAALDAAYKGDEGEGESQPRSAVLVILGTAHGSNTPGKRSPDGRLREYAWSREICSRVEARLKEDGYNVTVDLRQDYEPSLGFRVGVVNNLCAKYGAKNCCYVSIHINAAGMGDKWTSASYWTVWTSRGQTKGDKLATCIWDAAQELMPDKQKVKADWKDGDADFESNFYVLAKTNCAACLTENLMQDNKADVEWLMSEEGKRIVTEIHVRGIIKYIESI